MTTPRRAPRAGPMVAGAGDPWAAVRGWVAARWRGRHAWAYRGGRRDLRIDLLRGLALVAMIVDHVGGRRSWLYLLTGGNRFYVSAAEGFVFLSGLVMGLVYAGVVAEEGLEGALVKVLRRSCLLYCLSVALTLSFAGLSFALGLPWAPQLGRGQFSSAVVGVLTLHRAYYLTDVILLYALLVPAGGVALALIVQGDTRWVILGSWLLWLLWQRSPEQATLPWRIADNPTFHFSAWQLLFINGLALGYHRPRVDHLLARPPTWLLLGASGAVLAAAVLLYTGADALPVANPVSQARQLFGKADLRIGRLVVFAAAAMFAYTLTTRAWAPLHRLLGWLFVPLGQHSLLAYSAHLFVVALLARAVARDAGIRPARAVREHADPVGRRGAGVGGGAPAVIEPGPASALPCAGGRARWPR